MKTKLFLLFALNLLLASNILSCGGGGTTGTPGQLGLTIQAPNGDPISGATVWIPASSSSLSKLIVLNKQYTDGSGNTCEDPPETASYTSCTNANGVTTLSCDGTSSATVKYAKGSFSGQQTITCGSANQTLYFAAEDGGNMAVVTGNYDRMQDVLAKLGYGDVDTNGQLELGTETFKLYDANSSLDDSDYDNWSDVLLDTTELATNDIIFINCDEFDLGDELDTNTSTKIANLQDYVNNGGKLYVTDLSYDYVEQAFPNYIDYNGSGSGNGITAETAGAAENGSDDKDENATVNSTALAAWLDAITVNTGTIEDDCTTTTANGTTGARNSDGSVFIGDLLGGWAIMDDDEPSPSSAVTQWIIGTDLESATTRPLTVSFNVGSSGGRVLYTSYHTAESCPTTGFWPQERVLQYLVFEL